MRKEKHKVIVTYVLYSGLKFEKKVQFFEYLFWWSDPEVACEGIFFFKITKHIVYCTLFSLLPLHGNIIWKYEFAKFIFIETQKICM